MTNFIPEHFAERAFALTEELQKLQTPHQPLTALEQKVEEATTFLRESHASLQRAENLQYREFAIPVLEEFTNQIEKVKSIVSQTLAPAKAAQNLFTARCALQEGQTLFIRGGAPSSFFGSSSILSWDRGIPMAQIEPGVWVCTTNAPIKHGTEYKFLVNDKVWEEGENRKAGTPQYTAAEPRFNAQEIARVDKAEPSQNLISVICSLKEGNTLYIRGDNCGNLSWKQGIEMAQIQQGVWVFTTTAPLTDKMEYKFLVNDTVWEEGQNRKAQAGNLEARAPIFPAQYASADLEQRDASAAIANRMPSLRSLNKLQDDAQVKAAANGWMKAWELGFTLNPEKALSMANSSFDVDCIQWAMQQNLESAQENITSLRKCGMHELADYIESHMPELSKQYMMVLDRSINRTIDNDQDILQFGQLTPNQRSSVTYLRLQLHKQNLTFISENYPHARETTLRLTQTIQAIESRLQGFVPSEQEQKEAELHINVVNLFNSLRGALSRGIVSLKELSTYERDFFILHYFDNLQSEANQVMPMLDQYGDKQLADLLKKRCEEFKQELLPALLHLSFEGTLENDQRIAHQLKDLKGTVDAKVLNAIKEKRISIAENNAKYCPDIAPKPANVRKLYE